MEKFRKGNPHFFFPTRLAVLLIAQKRSTMELRLGLFLQMFQIGIPCWVRRVDHNYHCADRFAFDVGRHWLNRDDNILDDDEPQHALRLDTLVR